MATLGVASAENYGATVHYPPFPSLFFRCRAAGAQLSLYIRCGVRSNIRLLKEEAAEYNTDFRDSPVSPSTAAEAVSPLAHNSFPHSGCPWWPYSSARDFKTNTALVLLILFSAFVCTLSFNAVVRYLLRRRHHHHRRSSSPTHRDENYDDDDKAVGGYKTAEDEEVGAAISTMIFLAAEEGRGGVASEECIICLGEFVEGERVRVLENFKHCFHIHCKKPPASLDSLTRRDEPCEITHMSSILTLN